MRSGTRELRECWLQAQSVAASFISAYLVLILMATCATGLQTDVSIGSSPAGDRTAKEVCPHHAVSSTVEDAHDRVSKKGRLELTLKVRSSTDANGHARYCYTDEFGYQAPTLRVNPGDILVIHLKNEIAVEPPRSISTGPPLRSSPRAKSQAAHRDPCNGGTMSASSTNLHFHGLAIPPVCHQDETLKTVIQPGDPPFEYRVRIPETQPPGLYWYHPHIHGFSEEQLLGGESGALIVEGMARTVPQIAGLPQRVLVIRDEKMPPPPDGEKPDPNKPTKQLSLNYVPVPYPKYPTAVIKMKPGERQFWRVLNASADTYLSLAVEYDGKRQLLGLVSLDGVPLRYDSPSGGNYVPGEADVFLPPAGRAEFIITGPPTGATGRLVTHAVFRGADEDGKPVPAQNLGQPALRVGLDDVDPFRPLATIVPTTDSESLSPRDLPMANLVARSRPPLDSIRPVRKRTLYFSEKLVDPTDSKSATLFFITEVGHTPAAFDPSAEPNIIVHQGDVEDWTIENRSREVHTFHVHQLHFLVVRRQGTSWEEPSLRDTVNVAAWSGYGQYPSITVRMDFRDPKIVGTFPFHCHIVQHLDGGMMGTVQVLPRTAGATGRSQPPGERKPLRQTGDQLCMPPRSR